MIVQVTRPAKCSPSSHSIYTLEAYSKLADENYSATFRVGSDAKPNNSDYLKVTMIIMHTYSSELAQNSWIALSSYLPMSVLYALAISAT